MDAKDLMIGDWVMFNPNVFNDDEYEPYREPHPYQIKTGECVDDAVNGCYEPIPLTAEILEKNGFRFDGSGQRRMMFISEPHFADGIRFNIYVGLKHKTIEVFAAHPVKKSPNWRKSNKVYLEVCGCYVHELQHALKLCGIEKEIQL